MAMLTKNKIPFYQYFTIVQGKMQESQAVFYREVGRKGIAKGHKDRYDTKEAVAQCVTGQSGRVKGNPCNLSNRAYFPATGSAVWRSQNGLWMQLSFS